MPACNACKFRKSTSRVGHCKKQGVVFRCFRNLAPAPDNQYDDPGEEGYGDNDGDEGVIIGETPEDYYNPGGETEDYLSSTEYLSYDLVPGDDGGPPVLVNALSIPFDEDPLAPSPTDAASPGEGPSSAEGPSNENGEGAFVFVGRNGVFDFV